MEVVTGNSVSDADEDTINRLSSRAKKIQIDDHDVNSWEELLNTFREHYSPYIVSKFSRHQSSSRKNSGISSRSGNEPLCVLTDLFCDETTMLCGFTDGSCKLLNINELTDDDILLGPKNEWKHEGLSHICTSRTSPSVFFTSSTVDGVICQWDSREPSKKACQSFSIEQSSSSDGSKSRKKPILKFDLSCNDQLLCAGTEVVEEDSYLLFWDVRSTKLLGAYWESHSDDVTAVRFHPNQIHSLASGSTDGLLNVFNLLEPAEEDALLFSFNTNSSVDSLSWNLKNNASNVVCVTHTNEVQVWDSVSGDRVTEIDRKLMAKTMMRSNPEAVYITAQHNLADTSQIGLMTCSLSGGNSRLIELSDDMQPIPRGLFLDQTAVVQTAQVLSKSQQWITFDENGAVKLWNVKSSSGSEMKSHKSKKSGEERRNKKRFKPYNRE